MVVVGLFFWLGVVGLGRVVPHCPIGGSPRRCRGKRKAKEGKRGEGPELQATWAPADAEGDWGGKIRGRRDRRARQKPEGPQGTRGGGQEEKVLDKGTSATGPAVI